LKIVENYIYTTGTLEILVTNVETFNGQ